MKPKIAFACIVKGVDEEAAPFLRLMANVRDYVDGIFVTVTHHKGTPPSPAVMSVARDAKAVISEYEWTDDFAAARNFNFDQVPEGYTHIIWGDADDQFRGLHRLRDILTENPDADVFSLFYLYAFDDQKNPIVVHQKTQIVKRGCVRWIGRIHEDFKPLRNVSTFHIKGIERMHMTDSGRIKVAKERNLHIAKIQTATEPEDPRGFWNLGNAYGAFDDRYADEGIAAFRRFQELSLSDEEKYLVHLRIAELLWKKGKKNDAVTEARAAVGLRPEYPDAYHLLGSLHLELGQYERARDMYLQGMVKKPPYYSIIVFNPRDYDFTPLMNLAKAYFQLNQPSMALVCLKQAKKIMPSDPNLDGTIRLMLKEEKMFYKIAKLVKAYEPLPDGELLAKLEKLPSKYASHPALVQLRNMRFVKKESSGRDLVFFCGFTDEEWTPESVKHKGIGGSEEAILWLSKLLTEKGWNVTVYNNCGVEARQYGGVWFRPYWTFNYRDKQDAVVLWRNPSMAKYPINARVFVDLHDVIAEGEFTPERMKNIHKIFVKSAFHRSLFPSIPDEKFIITPNGIDTSAFQGVHERDPHLLVNTSSPDRGLRKAVELFRRIKEQVPGAAMKWAYGWGVWDAVHAENPKAMAWKDEMIKEMERAGVENLGRVNHETVAGLYRKASVFFYPSEFPEIDCISLSKAMAAGAVPVTTDFAAMGDKQGHGGTFLPSGKNRDNWAQPYQIDFSAEGNDDAFVEAVVALLKAGPDEKARQPMRDWANKTFDWHRIRDRWHHELSQTI